ncbi:hypothetical protein P8452_71824 [Trifolium repens]|nr:hypothetical protein P8452_71824 [Trifolium repens]
MKTFVQLHKKLLVVCGLVRGKDIVEDDRGERLKGKNILIMLWSRISHSTSQSILITGTCDEDGSISSS